MCHWFVFFGILIRIWTKQGLKCLTIWILLFYRYFYWFVVSLALLIILYAYMCIANVLIHYQETFEEDLVANPETTWKEAFWDTLSRYWSSVLGAFVAFLFSIFIFALCGFHSYIVSRALTTQEKLKHVYDYLPRSPFSFGKKRTDCRKILCCPRIPTSRLYQMLYLRHTNV